MTVPSETTRSTYSGSGVTTVFSTGFYFQANDQVRVRVTPSGGVESIKVEGIDYTVTRPTLGSGAPGSVTFTVAPPNLAAIVIERVVDLTQDISLRTVGTFSPAVHEDKFDELIFQIQQVARDLDDVVLGSSSANIAAGSGLTSTGSAPVTLHVGAGNGVIVSADAVAVDYGTVGLMEPTYSEAAAELEGISPKVARIDHRHIALTAAAGAIAIGDTASAGSAFELAKADHRHALAAPAAPANVTKSAASAGAATTVARADHKHDVTTAAAVSLTDTTNAEGVATSLARSDHTHGHGNRGGGTLHALATAVDPGFMSAADKASMVALGAVAIKSHVIATQGSQSIPTAVGALIVSYTELTDANGEFNPTTGLYTAKDAGVVIVTAQVLSVSAAWVAGKAIDIQIQKNGVSYGLVAARHFFDAAATRVGIVETTRQIPVAIGDTIGVFVVHDQGANVNFLTHLSIKRLL